MKLENALVDPGQAGDPLRRGGRRFTAILVGIMLALWTSGSVVCRDRNRQSANHPVAGPVVIFLVDTLRPDRMSVYGGNEETSPAAQALAREARVYENAFALSTWTRASVATMLTSRLPSENGVWNRLGRVRESVDYLPQLFQRKGWTTAAFIGNGNVFDPRAGFQRGYDVYAPILGEADTLKPRASEVVDPAVRFIERQRSSRFLLFVHVVDPHLPYQLDQPAFRGQKSWDGDTTNNRGRLLEGYDLAIRQADDQFGRVARSLIHRNWWATATVIYTGDHGEEFYEHGAQGHGRTLYEEQIRVPLILKLPHGRGAGERSREIVSLADLTPTLAALAGLPRSPDWIGQDLLHLGRRPAALYLTQDLDDVRVFAARTRTRKIVVQLYPRFERRIYDLDRDPGESAPMEMPCGASAAGDEALYRWLLAQRGRDVRAAPGVEIARVRGAAYNLDLSVNVGPGAKPFFTAENLCAYAPSLVSGSLRIRREIGANAPFDLTLAASDWGQSPVFRLSLVSPSTARPAPDGRDAPVLFERKPASLMVGPTSDDLIHQLRALGYLTGGRVKAAFSRAAAPVQSSP